MLSTLATIDDVGMRTIGPEEIRKKIALLEQEKKEAQEALARYTADGSITPDEKEFLEQRIAMIQDGIDFHKRLARGEQDVIAKEIYADADKLSQSAAKDIEKAKQGLGKAGQFAVDVGVGLTQLGGDIAIGMATGGGALLPMAFRGFGGATQEARQAGATLDQQVLYGLGSAAVSVLTEKISNVAKPLAKAFGKGVADDAINQAISKAINKMAKTQAGQAALSRLASIAMSAAGEGFEEALESVISPLLKRATYDKDAKWDLDEIIYDGLVGAAIGGFMGGFGGIDVQPQVQMEEQIQGPQTPQPEVQVQPQTSAVEGTEAIQSEKQKNAELEIETQGQPETIAQETVQAPQVEREPVQDLQVKQEPARNTMQPATPLKATKIELDPNT